MSGGGTSTEQAETLTHKQKEVQRAFADRYLTRRIGRGLPSYEPYGDLYKPLTQEEVAAYLRAGEPYSQFYSQMVPSMKSAWGSALSGTPTQTFSESEMEDFIASQRALGTHQFETEVIPGVREAYRGPGTYWGGVRAKAEERARTEHELTRQARESALRMQGRQEHAALEEAAKDRQAAAASALTEGYAGSAMGSMVGTQALRAEEQRMLDIQFQDFMRQLPINSPIIEQALAFLNTPMMATGFSQERGFWDYATPIIQSGISAIGYVAGNVV